MAQKKDKAARNGRDSNRRLGVSEHDGNVVTGGSISVRQHGRRVVRLKSRGSAKRHAVAKIAGSGGSRTKGPAAARCSTFPVESCRGPTDPINFATKRHSGRCWDGGPERAFAARSSCIAGDQLAAMGSRRSVFAVAVRSQHLVNYAFIPSSVQSAARTVKLQPPPAGTGESRARRPVGHGVFERLPDGAGVDGRFDGKVQRALGTQGGMAAGESQCEPPPIALRGARGRPAGEQALTRTQTACRRRARRFQSGKSTLIAGSPRRGPRLRLSLHHNDANLVVVTRAATEASCG